MKRDLAELTRREFDIVIIGGGIYGATLAWDAALRGLSVALLEKNDFGHATSASTGHIAHAGFRYIQNMDIKRLRESTRERNIFMRIAPHLIEPVPFMIPTYERGIQNKELLRAAVALYEVLSFDKNRGIKDPKRKTPAGRIISRDECLRIAPGLSEEGLTGAAIWYDGLYLNTERLTLAFVFSAAEKGAVVANYTEVTGFLKVDNKIIGVRTRNVLQGNELEVRGKLVINTSGPWVNRLLSLVNGKQPKKLVALSKVYGVITRAFSNDGYGVGFMVPHFEGEKCIEAGCCQRMHITPWRGRSIISSINVQANGTFEDLRVTEEEIAKLVRAFNAAYPNMKLKMEDVSIANVGLLPRYEEEAHDNPYKLAHHYRIIDHHNEDGLRGLISIIGVKYTTARDIAEKVVNLAIKKLGLPHVPSRSRTTPLINTTVDSVDATYAVRKEMAQKLQDVVFRRTELGMFGYPAKEALKNCAELMAKELNWDSKKIEEEIEDTENEFRRRGARIEPDYSFSPRGEGKDEGVNVPSSPHPNPLPIEERGKLQNSSQKIKILHVYDKLTVEHAMSGLVRNLATLYPKMAHEYEFIVCSLRREDEGARILRRQGFEVHTISKGRLNPFKLIDLLRIIKKEKPDLLHSHSYASADFSRLASWITGIPMIQQQHFCWRIPWYQRVVDFILQGIPKRVIAISESVKRFMAKYQSISEEKIEVIWNGTEISKNNGARRKSLREDFQIPEDHFIVSLVGRLHRIKGQDLMIDAVPRVLEKIPNTTFVFAGAGKIRSDLEKKARERGIERNVRFTGFVEEVEQVYSQSDAVVIPSLSEAFGLTAVEAMSFGCAIVASQVEGLAEILEDEKNALLIQPGEKKALAENVVRLLKDSSLRKKIGTQAESDAKQYSIDRVASSFSRIYRDVLESQANAKSGMGVAGRFVLGTLALAAFFSLAAYGVPYLPPEIRNFFQVACEKIYLNPLFYGFVGFVFLLEKWIPIRKTQSVFSVSMLQDFVWFNADLWFRMTLLPLYIGALYWIYHRYLGFLTVDLSLWMPELPKVLLLLLLADFLRWFHHWVRHKVSLFWYFHSVHHSQREINLFTDARVHMVEKFITQAIMFIPFFMFQADVESVLVVGLFMKMYPKLTHANIKTNLGWLRYVLVTPQSHRIHHSLRIEHRDKNFGVLFSIWDHLFGTQYRNYDDYPDSGVDDPNFPHEKDTHVFKNLLSQLVYPFRLAAGEFQKVVAK